MKIGVFDSGLGGLVVLRSLARALPRYDYVYLGDTERVPYGNRSPETVHRFLLEAVDYLFSREQCGLIIVACNTASAEALRRIQREYLPRRYSRRRVLGVIIPTAEAALAGKPKRVGVLATAGTVRSGAFVRELRKIDPRVRVDQQAAPLLVPVIENGGGPWIRPILASYLAPLMKKKPDAIILGCTHYPILKRDVKAIAKTRVISQDELMPERLKDYLSRHPEIKKTLTKTGQRRFLVTDLTPSYEAIAKRWFGPRARLERVKIGGRKA